MRGICRFLLGFLLAVRVAEAQPSVAGLVVSFEGETQACAGGVADALHTFEMVARVQDERGRPVVGWEVNFESAGAPGPRFVLPGGALAKSRRATSGVGGRIALSVRSGQDVGTFRVVARAAAADPEIGARTLRVVAAECRRRFPWRWVGHTDPNEVTSAGDRGDDGWLSSDPGGRAPVSVHKFYLKYRRDARRGNLDGNWAVVNGHRVRVWIYETRFEDPDRNAPDVVITEPRRIAKFWHIEGAARRDPTQITVTTRGDGAAGVRVRRVAGLALPRALAGRSVSYALGYTDESQAVDEPPALSLSLRGRLPERAKPQRARLFAPPPSVRGTVVWTVAGEMLSKPLAPNSGLYFARFGQTGTSAIAGTPQQFASKIGGEAGLAIAPDGERVVFDRDPTVVEEQSPDFWIVVSSLAEIDLATGQSRVLIADKDSRSDFDWSPDGRYLLFSGTAWRFPWEQMGGGVSHVVTHPPVVLDLQTLQVARWDASPLKPAAWTHDSRLLWSEFVSPNAIPNAAGGYARTMQSPASGSPASLWRAGAWEPQSSPDGRQRTFLALERPQLRKLIPTTGATHARPFGTTLWAQDGGSAPRPLTRVEDSPVVLWSRDGTRMVSVAVEDEDVLDYWATEVQRAAQVTVWNWREGTIESTFKLQGNLVRKASGHPVTQRIVPLELSPNGQIMFVRYEESDPKTATREAVGTLSQAIFAIDIASQSPHLLASFTGVSKVAWRAK